MTFDPSKWLFCADCKALHPPGKHREPPEPEQYFKSPSPSPAPRTVDDLLGTWAKPTAARPEVELSAERRAHVGRWAAELKEWKANGATPNEALQLVAMEMQLEFHRKRQEGGS